MTVSLFENAQQQGQAGYFLRGLLLSGNPKLSEGIYKLNHWSVRLGAEAHADEAHMASLHEMYHATLNDSTAYGTLMHLAGLYYSAYPDEPMWLNFLDEIFGKAVQCHESFATYASVFIVGKGTPQKELLSPYPIYKKIFANANSLVKHLPNDLLGFQMIQSACRVSMQADCFVHFLNKPPTAWRLSDLTEMDFPDQRFCFLLNCGVAETVCSHLQDWAKNQNEQIQWLVNMKHADQAAYYQMIMPEFDVANDLIGYWFYDFFAEYVRNAGASCLEYNGHQAWVADFVHKAQSFLPEDLNKKRLQAAPHGIQEEEQTLLSFANEQLVISPEPYEALLYNLSEIPEKEWAKLFTGPEKHGLITIRPSARMLKMYYFSKSDRTLLEQSEVLVCLRRRVVEPESGRVVMEHFLIESIEVLSRLGNLRTTEVFFIASCSMLCLADKKWQRKWVPVLRDFAEMTVLVDLNPFQQIHAWQRQGSFEILYSSCNLEDRGKRHVVYVLFPETGDDLLYLIPCSGIFANAMTYGLQSVFQSDRLHNNNNFLQARQKLVVYTMSHLLREEPWFDFLAV